VNVIGERLRVLTSPVQTFIGRSGLVLLDTANTLLIDDGGRTIRVPKVGSAFLLLGSGKVVTGADIAGKLPERMGRRKP